MADVHTPIHQAWKSHTSVPAAEVVPTVEVFHLGDAVLRRRVLEAVQNLPAQALLLDPPLAALPVHLPVGRGRVVMVLAADEVGQHLPPRPPALALQRRRPHFIVVCRLPPHVDHAVDARGAAEHLAPGVVERAPAQARDGLRLEAPVHLGVGDAPEVALYVSYYNRDQLSATIDSGISINQKRRTHQPNRS